MKKTARFVIWICSKFTRQEIEEIIKDFSDVLANRNPDIKPKDDFKEKHPHYRDFFVDANPAQKFLPKLLQSWTGRDFYLLTRRKMVIP